MVQECRDRNISQSDYLLERITKHTGSHRREDGLQIATLKSLHTLKALLNDGDIDLIERREKGQIMFDHLYEMFFSKLPESTKVDTDNPTDDNI